MNHSFGLTGPAAGMGAGPRTVDRAVGDLRRGIAVVLRSEDAAPLLVLAAETASPATLDEFQAAMAPGGAPALLVASSRAAGLDGKPWMAGAADRDQATVALALRSEDLDVGRLRALADPTRGKVMSGRADALAWPEESGRAALLLAKLGRLLPAVLVADAAAGPACTGLLQVDGADILTYPQITALGLVQAASAHVPLQAAGDARVVAFRPADGGIEHLAVLIGRPEEAPSGGQAPLVRIHSECFTGDLLGSLRCDCGPQLHQAIRRMAAEGAGVLLYMAQEGRGIGLVNKLRAYALQDGLDGGPKLDTLDANRALGYGADERSFSAAATMLKRLGITRVRLLTNNPDKVAGLAQRGIDVVGRVSHAIAANGVNDSYLETKARRLGHLLG